MCARTRMRTRAHVKFYEKKRGSGAYDILSKNVQI